MTVKRICTDLYNIEADDAAMPISEVAKQLTRLRERAGYGVREFAALLGYSASRYHYYEREFKQAYLPVEFVEKVAPFLLGKGQPPITIGEITAMYASKPIGQVVASHERDTSEVEVALDAPTAPAIRSQMRRDVPVLGTATGGSDADFTVMNGDALDFVRRPPRIEGRKDVFALWVRSNSMAKWRSSGDLVYCEEVRAPQNGEHVVILMKAAAGDDHRPAFLKKLVSSGGNNYTVEQYNPAKQFKIAKDKVQAIYRVIDWAELLSV